MKTKLTLTLITLATLIISASIIAGATSAAPMVDDNVNPFYKGGSSFNLAGAGPNEDRALHVHPEKSCKSGEA